MTRGIISYPRFVRAVAITTLLVIAAPSALAQGGKPYTLQDVIGFLRGRVSPASVLARVKSQCIDFRVTSDVRQAILAAGGNDQLIGGLMGTCVRSSAAASAPATVRTASTAKKPVAERPAPRATTVARRSGESNDRARPAASSRERDNADPVAVPSARPASSSSKVYTPSEVDEQARPLPDRGINLVYTEELQAERGTSGDTGGDGPGDVVVGFVVDPDGRIDVSTIRALGILGPRLQAAIETALTSVAFTPATVQGKNVRQVSGYYMAFGPGDTVVAEPVHTPDLIGLIVQQLGSPGAGSPGPQPAETVAAPRPIPPPTEPPTPGLEELAARTRVFRFFEGPRSVPALGTRQYTDRFDTQATRFVYVEMELDFVGPSAIATYSLPCDFVGPGGDVISNTRIDGSRGPSVGTFIAVFGRGWDATGNWAPGKYQAICRYKDKVIASGTFEVTGVTVASAYAAGDEAALAQQWSAAADQYRLASELSPETHLYHYKLGYSLVKAGSLAAAEAPLLRAVELAPTEKSYLWELVQLLIKQERSQEVEPYFRKYVEMDASNAALHQQLGELLVKNGKIPDAISAYEKAAALAPGEAYYAHRVQELRTQLPD